MIGQFTFKAYQRELERVQRKLEELRPAAEVLTVKVSLERAIAGILKAKSEARYVEVTKQMTGPQITPGPWIVDDNAVHQEASGGLCRIALCGELRGYGERWTGRQPDHAQTVANAKAIAAVPTMIEALRYIADPENRHSVRARDKAEEALRQAGVEL